MKKYQTLKIFLLAFILGALVAGTLASKYRYPVEVVESQAQAEKIPPQPVGEYLPKNLFVELSKRVNPAVVNISTTQTIRGGRRFMINPGMPVDPFEDFFGQFMGGGMRQPEQKVMSLGSGFIIDGSGLIITNYHVIENANDIQVQLTEKSKKTYGAKVIGSDSRTDIALIKISADSKLTSVTLGNSDQIEVGEWVAAFGNPLGHGHSISKGIISAKDREIELENASYAFLQTDTAINPGNSGGPLVSTAGEVIGVNSAIDARGQGIGFAIPINIVKKLLPDLKSKGKITRGFLGVVLEDISDQMVKQFKLKSDKGALVVDVSPDSPAEKGGLLPYDVILEFEGKEIESARNLTNSVAETSAGSTVKIKVMRKGKLKILSIKISERPDELTLRSGQGGRGRHGETPPEGTLASAHLGFTFMDLNPSIAQQLRLQAAPRKGVVIVEVKQESLAEQAGLQVGDIIIDINQTKVRSSKEANETFKKLKGTTLSMRILRGQNTILIFMEGE